MFCPQCGSEIGEAARACARCGWTASRRTLWIVLGCVLGFGVLLCCGVGTWLGLKLYRAGTAMMAKLTPEIVFLNRVMVVNYARHHGGKLPATLEEASTEPIRKKGGGTVEINIKSGDGVRDTWQKPLRFRAAPDGGFEVRSAGPDGQFDNADDIVEKGRADDDLDRLQADLEARWQKLGEEFLRGLGIDPEKVKEGESPAPAPPQPQPPPPAPPGGGGEGGK